MSKRDEALKESNSALKDANNALKELVNSLKNERAMLLEKNKALEAKLAVKRLKQGKDQEPDDGVSRCLASKLPHAVLLSIFRALILPWESYNTSVAAGPRSRWLVSLNTRTARVLVCKHWYGPASQALYSDIVLRRMGEISALARTLRSTAVIYAPDRSRFIRRIYVNECIVLPAAASVVKEDLTFLLHRCTNVRTFALRSCLGFSGDELDVDTEDRDWSNPAWYGDMNEDAPGSALAERCATGLEELTLIDSSVSVHMAQIHRLLSIASNLRQLVLGPLSDQCDLSEMLNAVPPGPLSLVALEDLQLPNTDDAFRTYVQEMWVLPALQRLTLVGCEHFPKGLLEAHGQNLTYLHLLYDGKTSSASWSDLALIEDLCPALEHLVLPYILLYSPPNMIRSPSLRYLDMWGLTPKRQVVELMLQLAGMCWLPELRRIRILPHQDEGVLPARLPLLCHPEDVDEDGMRVRVFPGVYILQTSWALLVHRMLNTAAEGVVFEDDPWAESASDMLYQCEEDVGTRDDEEGNEEDEFDMASDVDSAASGNGRKVGKRDGSGVDEEDLDEEWEEDEEETATQWEEGEDEVKEGAEREEGDAEGKWHLTREEVLERFCQGQKACSLFNEE